MRTTAAVALVAMIAIITMITLVIIVAMVMRRLLIDPVFQRFLILGKRVDQVLVREPYLHGFCNAVIYRRGRAVALHFFRHSRSPRQSYC